MLVEFQGESEAGCWANNTLNKTWFHILLKQDEQIFVNVSNYRGLTVQNNLRQRTETKPQANVITISSSSGLR